MAKLLDFHTHSSFSPDAKSSAEDMVKRAIELGITDYSITDHCDCNYWYPFSHYAVADRHLGDENMYNSGDYAIKSIEEQCGLKAKYADRINLHIGIELGQPLQNVEIAEMIASDLRLDFVIGSHHMNNGMEDFYFLMYNKMDFCELNRLMSQYFIEILEMVKWNKFDVLGHLTYPLRYMSQQGVDCTLSCQQEIIREIFRTLISNGKGIEINTSGLRQPYGKTFPTFEYVKMYHDLGGEIITLGSDAHCTDDLGKGIAQGVEIAKSAGFNYITVYDNRKPSFHRL